MQRGSIVRCNTNFDEERAYYRYPYPWKGDLLEVRGLTAHYPSGKMLMTFEELYKKIPIPLSEDCFDEVQTPEEGNAILRFVKQFLTKKF